jgi:hypothetical protein
MSSPNVLERATMGGPILCLARALLAAPFGPSAMCFLRTAQCFGWHGPNISHNRLGNTFRHHLAKNCPKTRPPARTPGCIPRAPSGSDRWDFFNHEKHKFSGTNGERLRRRILFSVLFVARLSLTNHAPHLHGRDDPAPLPPVHLAYPAILKSSL